MDQGSLVGLKYMRSGEPLLQRFLWLLIFFVALFVFLILFSKTLSKYYETPVIMGPDKYPHHVWEIPFPAITICPESKINMVLFNYTDVTLRWIRNQTITEEELNVWYDLTHQCHRYEKDTTSETPNVTTIDRIEQFAMKIEDIMVPSTFRSMEDPHFMQFEPILTEGGICFSFNMLPGRYLFPNNTFHASRNYLNYHETVRWRPGIGYHQGDDLQAYPFRAWGAGYNAGLNFHVYVNNDNLDYVCSGAVEGFKLLVHGPADFPLPEQRAMLLPLDSQVRVAVTPHHVMADASLRDRFSPRERLCYFPGERRLRFFSHYTQTNCELECLANYTKEYCDCVPYYMPRETTTSICGDSKFSCFTSAQLKMQKPKIEGNGPREIPCNCLQSCNYVEYKSQRSVSTLLVRKLEELESSKLPDNFTRATKISIYFDEPTFIPDRRIEMYSLVDIIANCGGLLGLCLGMSILSMAELIYWLVVKSFWTDYRKRSAMVSPYTGNTIKDSSYTTNMVLNERT